MFFSSEKETASSITDEAATKYQLKKLKTQCSSAFHLRAWNRHWPHSQILPTLTGGKENKQGKI